MLFGGSDFVAYLRVSADGEPLAWIAWKRPDMPWDASGVYVADLMNDRSEGITRVAGAPNESVLDIASMALKRQVDTIVLVTGDSDFVPAAKLARREGVEFLLDPLWQRVSEELTEHADGVLSVFPKPISNEEELIAA